MSDDTRKELDRIEAERKTAETRLDNALRHLADMQANQLARDERLREAILRSVAALMEGLRETPPEEQA